MSRCAVKVELGQLTSAQRDLDQAVASLAAAGRPHVTPELAMQQAVLYYHLGNLVDSAALYERILSRSEGTARNLAIAGNNLALIHSDNGRFGLALSRLDEALERARSAGLALVALVSATQAWVTVQSGQLTVGLKLLSDAAVAYVEAGLPLGEHYLEFADAMLDLRLIPEARTAVELARSEFASGGVALMGAEAQLRAAQLALLAGDHRSAMHDSRAAVATFKQQRRPTWQSRALLLQIQSGRALGESSGEALADARLACRQLESRGLLTAAVEAQLVRGELAAERGRRHESRQAWERAAQLAGGAPVLIRLRGRLAAALSARQGHRDDLVLRHCRSGLGDLDRHRAALPTMELRALASGHGQDLGRLGLQVALHRGSGAKALTWMELTRAASLSIVQPTPTTIDEVSLGELRTVHQQLMERTRSGGDLREERALLLRQTQLENRIRRSAWSAQVGSSLRGRWSLSQLRERLAGRSLVEYAALDGQLAAVVVRPSSCRLVVLGPSTPVQAAADDLFAALRRLLRPRRAAVAAASRASAQACLDELESLLIRPLGVPPDDELVVVPSGRLHSVPWSALHRAPVSLAPSASSWARTVDLTPPPAQAVTLVAGPGLLGATEEIAALKALYPSASVLTPPFSTVAGTASSLQGATLAHLACHGLLRSDNPMFSSLQLHDGVLTVQELDTRGVAPYRIILAACDAGAGVSFAGDELIGFVSALMARGSAGLLASLAPVPDLQAVDLMVSVHRHLIEGETLSRALHAARQSLDVSDPGAYISWCSFGVHGAA
jgi:tetratricopeptide (TPR) repeat protein